MAASLVPKSSFGPRQLEEPRNHRDRVAFTDEIASSLSLSLSFATRLLFFIPPYTCSMRPFLSLFYVYTRVRFTTTTTTTTTGSDL